MGYAIQLDTLAAARAVVAVGVHGVSWFLYVICQASACCLCIHCHLGTVFQLACMPTGKQVATFLSSQKHSGKMAQKLVQQSHVCLHSMVGKHHGATRLMLITAKIASCPIYLLQQVVLMVYAHKSGLPWASKCAPDTIILDRSVMTCCSNHRRSGLAPYR